MLTLGNKKVWVVLYGDAEHGKHDIDVKGVALNECTIYSSHSKVIRFHQKAVFFVVFDVTFVDFVAGNMRMAGIAKLVGITDWDEVLFHESWKEGATGDKIPTNTKFIGINLKTHSTKWNKKLYTVVYYLVLVLAYYLCSFLLSNYRYARV